MRILSLICLTLAQLAKQAWLLPKTFTLAVEQKRRQALLDGREAERLDRIRNPSKYQGR